MHCIAADAELLICAERSSNVSIYLQKAASAELAGLVNAFAHCPVAQQHPEDQQYYAEKAQRPGLIDKYCRICCQCTALNYDADGIRDNLDAFKRICPNDFDRMQRRLFIVLQ